MVVQLQKEKNIQSGRKRTAREGGFRTLVIPQKNILEIIAYLKKMYLI
jgi:hypothetical protein